MEPNENQENAFTRVASPKAPIGCNRATIQRPWSTANISNGKRSSVVRRQNRPHSTCVVRSREVAAVQRRPEVSEAGRQHLRMGTPTDGSDYISVDIFDDSGWDTDCDNDKSRGEKDDYSSRRTYLEACRQQKVIPASYFVRHMNDARLEMKHHGLGATGIRPIAEALVSNADIVRLSMQDNWLGRHGGTIICNMLKENCYIADLDLSDNNLDYVFAEKFAEVLSVNITLTHVTLAGNALDDKAAEFISESLMQTMTLKHLDLSDNRLGVMAGVMLGPGIAENSSLKSLDLSWNGIRAKGAVAIANGIKYNGVMAQINLSCNGFGTRSMQAMGEALKANSTLKDLNIANNRITAEGAILLGKGLAVNDSLQILKMGRNTMQSAGCLAICASIVNSPSCALKLLDFTSTPLSREFWSMFGAVKERLPGLTLRHGHEGAPQKPKAIVHPAVKLKNFILRHNLRFIDFFNQFDTDHSMSVTREEFTLGIANCGIKLSEDEINILLDTLDKDDDGEINYSEFAQLATTQH